MKTLYASTIACLFAMLLFSCHKHEEVPTTTTYTFVNQTGGQIYFDTYPSQEDYSQNRNRAKQYMLEPDESRRIEFDLTKSNWVDWYNTDYTYNNWQGSISSYNHVTPAPGISLAAIDDGTYYLRRSTARDTLRSILLNGSGISTTWIAKIIGVSGLSGTHKFIFRKDFTCDYTYTPDGGGVIETVVKYGVTTSNIEKGAQTGFILNIVNDQSSIVCQATCNPGLNTYPRTGRDTMLIRFFQPSSSVQYPAVRQ